MFYLLRVKNTNRRRPQQALPFFFSADGQRIARQRLPVPTSTFKALPTTCTGAATFLYMSTGSASLQTLFWKGLFQIKTQKSVNLSLSFHLRGSRICPVPSNEQRTEPTPI